MHKVSRTLLLAGVVAFGTLTAACGDKVTVAPQSSNVGVQSVTVTPANATIPSGTTIQLSASVVADASTAKTVTWTTSSAAVATVDQTGKVTGTAAGGTATVLAISTVDASKSGAALIVVTPATPGTPAAVPTVSISSVNGPGGLPVNLANVAGQVDVTVNTSGGGTIDLFLSPSANCTTNTIASNDVKVASQVTSSPQAGQITLSFNTAALITPANTTPQFINGGYCIKSQLTSATGVKVVATNTQPITLNNVSFYKATLAFVSQTGGPTSAVSTTNGLNYNQGTLTATITPVNFNSGSAVALISGSLSLNGEQGGAAVPAGAVAFTNVPVTNGVATVVFTDTAITIPGNFAGVRSIAQYQSTPAGDNLFITSATDAAGNPVTAAVTAASGLRIDNDFPTLNGSAVPYAVVAPNGFIGAAYTFASGTGTTGAASTDTKAGVQGVGGVTTTYYVGAAGSAAFATANSCNITGLAAATVGTDLANTLAINADQAKVVIKDALGNQQCKDVPSTFAGGLFGVDKIAPTATFTSTSTTVGANTGVADLTGYNIMTKGFNFTFQDSISGFPLAVGSSPFVGTLLRNFYATPSAADCVIGNFIAASKTCADTTISTATAPSFTETTAGSGVINGGFQFTNGTNVVGYYTVKATIRDVAGNVGPTLTRAAAYDNVPPTVAAPTQAASVVSLGSATVNAGAADNLDLISSRGNLSYGALVTFARQTGNTLGAFGQFVTNATATVVLPNVYRGLQDGSSGTITAGITAPSASVTVTDVGGNVTTSGLTTLTTTTTAASIFVGNTISLASSATSGSASANAATTNLTVQIGGLSTDPAFQSQPFAQVDIYKLNTGTGEYALVGSVSAASVVDNTTTGARTFTYILSGAALSPGTLSGASAAATNTFIAIGRNAAGDAVKSPSVTQINN